MPIVAKPDPGQSEWLAKLRAYRAGEALRTDDNESVVLDISLKGRKRQRHFTDYDSSDEDEDDTSTEASSILGKFPSPPEVLPNTKKLHFRAGTRNGVVDDSNEDTLQPPHPAFSGRLVTTVSQETLGGGVTPFIYRRHPLGSTPSPSPLAPRSRTTSAATLKSSGSSKKSRSLVNGSNKPLPPLPLRIDKENRRVRGLGSQFTVYKNYSTQSLGASFKKSPLARSAIIHQPSFPSTHPVVDVNHDEVDGLLNYHGEGYYQRRPPCTRSVRSVRVR